MAARMQKAAHDLQSRRRTDDVLQSEGLDFGSLLLSQPVLLGLAASGFQRPSPIQLKAIPLGRCGLDLIVQAKSGTGKTCVFTTIALDSLVVENPATQVLVLAPTREIAVQIHSVITAIGIEIEGLQCHVFIGGTPVSLDRTRLKKCHIAVGSPGRVKQLIEMGYLATASIRLFVLDEADKLLEEGSFQDQINWIYSSLPVNKQMLALSATYPEALAQHLARYMRDPTFVRLNPSDPGLLGLKQYYKIVKSHPLPHKIFQEKVQHLLDLFSKIPFNQALVFSNLHSRAQRLADILTSKGLPAVCISGSLTQDQRLEAMSKLKQYKCRVLISTDLTSRGIDAEKVNLVINLDVPQDWETYMHRIGRAGRFGTHGLAVTYCCHGEEENEMMTIAQKCSLTLSCLPDPLPPGLMEEPSDWDVTIESAQTLPDRPAASPKLMEHQNQGLQIEGTASPFPSRGAEPHNTQPFSLGKPKPKKPEQPRPIKTDPTPRKPVNVSVLRSVSTSQTTPRELREKPQRLSVQDQAALQDALPKISPLPSFKAKPHCMRPMSLAELAEDYESFIKDGPGRTVEIIRRYTGLNDAGQQTVEEVKVEGGVEQGVPQTVSRDCERESSFNARLSSYSDRSTSSEAGEDSRGVAGEDSRDVAGEDSRGVAGEDSRGVDDEALGEPMEVSMPIQRSIEKISASPPAVPKPSALNPRVFAEASSEHASGKTGIPEHRAGLDPHPEPPRQKPKASKRGAEKSRFGAEDHDEALDQGSEEPGQDSPQEYWKAYFEAWHRYYAAVGQPHQRGYRRSFNWMSAYQMNAVYMEELLKH
ncbi:putative ATP-dependent RNA helicase DDX20 [Acipenser oxyrinchus oxyrinchus]|uniref:RNA helicase n=1 Tax=Acipenser oxyrinchus oxyrinchus TaxID=40147 RepID=A0AAD8CN63_ACIOX|nr:putative ATP-dependent RNA helicase DDX20 [Acipenser oxyrinchus oxyrinchus]